MNQNHKLIALGAFTIVSKLTKYYKTKSPRTIPNLEKLLYRGVYEKLRDADKEKYVKIQSNVASGILTSDEWIDLTIIQILNRDNYGTHCLVRNPDTIRLILNVHSDERLELDKRTFKGIHVKMKTSNLRILNNKMPDSYFMCVDGEESYMYTLLKSNVVAYRFYAYMLDLVTESEEMLGIPCDEERKCRRMVKMFKIV